MTISTSSPKKAAASAPAAAPAPAAKSMITPRINTTWPSPGKINASAVADKYNDEIKDVVDRLVALGIGRPRLVTFLANGDTAAETYARMTKRACEKNGVAFELRRPERLDLETAVVHANGDPSVHGVLVYYPVFGGGMDAYLRDVVSHEKDVEGLHHTYTYAMYHNMRTIESVFGKGGKNKKCVLPCTPLACIKVLEFLGAYDKSEPVGQQLRGRTAVVFNRSEVVGRPLAAMMANDGAKVYSIDEHGMVLFRAGAVAGSIKVEETSVDQKTALAEAHIVVSGVPVKSFQIEADSMRAGAIAINVSQFMNFGVGVEEKCALVPAMGKVTIAMLARNLIRLHDNFALPKLKRQKERSEMSLWERLKERPELGVAAVSVLAALAISFSARRN